MRLHSGKYKGGYCPDFAVQSFSYATFTDDLCETDELRVNQAAGAICMIKAIVDITKEDTLAPQKSKR